jgi:hypothetical protein
MGVRKIPKNSQRVISLVVDSKRDTATKAESSLERDFYILMRYDLNVLKYEGQPVRISFCDKEGVDRTYTPDALVEFRTDIVPAKGMRPWLCEIKYEEDLRKNKAEYAPKFKAGRCYARGRGWEFKILTEKHIRTPYLDNVKFLTQYRNIDVDDNFESLILKTLYEFRETDPESLLTAIFRDKWNKAQLIPSLWHLVTLKRVGVDLSVPLTMSSRIWHVDF